MMPRILLAVLCGLALANSSMAETKIHLKAGTIDPEVQLQAANSSDSFTRYYIVQFKAAPSQQNFKELKQQNIEWHRYIPDNALLVEVPKNFDLKKLAVSQFKSVIPYLPNYKVNPQLQQINVFNRSERKVLNIKFFTEKDLLSVMDKINSMGLSVLATHKNYMDVLSPLAAVHDLANIEGVEFITEKQQVETMYLPVEIAAQIASSNDYSQATGYETGTRVMNFDVAWNKGLMGQGQSVAMADTGLDTGDLNTLQQDFMAVSHGYAYGIFSKSWYDPMGHGTHVAGSVVSSGSASGGIFKGGAYEAKMIGQGMWSDMMKNLSIPPSLDKFLTPAYNDGARVHTNSWGSPRNLGAYDGMSVQVDEFMWDHPEMLIVFAAGNSGEDSNKDGRVDEGSVSSPSTAKNCLSVGASENLLSNGGIQRPVGELAGGRWKTEPLGSDKISDNPNGIAVFSSRGPTKDGRIKPDVVAPGTNIVSNCSKVKDASPLWGNYNSEYCYSGGTSMAAPLAAGAAVVVRQSLVQKGFVEPSAAAVKAVLMNTAVDLYPGQFGNVGKNKGQEILSPGPNFHQGHGRVDVARAIDDNLSIVDEINGLSQGDVHTHQVTLAEGVTEARLTLVYTDRPAASSASKTLVNNLDIEVVKASGEVLKASDSVNNSESLSFSVAGSGTLTVKVLAPRVISGEQPYALVVSQK